MKSASDARLAKRRLRSEIRAARRRFSAQVQRDAAAALAHQAVQDPVFARAVAIACYVANDGELETTALLDRLWQAGKRVLLPRCRPDLSIELVATGPGVPLLPTGPAGLLEPAGPAVGLDEVVGPVLLATPAVALDVRGNRLGRGGGAYDRLIPEVRRKGWSIVGVCHSAHVLPVLPTEDHDQPVDAILTEKGLLATSNGAPLPDDGL